MPIDALTGRQVMWLDEALERALTEHPMNHTLVKSLFRAFEYGQATGQRGFVDYESVREICMRSSRPWDEPGEDRADDRWR